MSAGCRRDIAVKNAHVPQVEKQLKNTKWTELKAPDIITHFPASSSCGCNDFSTGNITTTTNVLTQQPTVNTSIPLGQGAQDVSYGNFGAKFYSDTTSTISYDISQTNTYFGSPNQN